MLLDYKSMLDLSESLAQDDAYESNQLPAHEFRGNPIDLLAVNLIAIGLTLDQGAVDLYRAYCEELIEYRASREIKPRPAASPAYHPEHHRRRLTF